MNGAIFRWAGLLLGQGVILTGMILGWLSTRKTVRDVDTKVDSVAGQATKAAELAEPTGNGYARRTEAALATILAKVERVETKLDRHIDDHASADVRRRAQ